MERDGKFLHISTKFLFDFALNISSAKEDTNTYPGKEGGSFYLIIQSMFYKKETYYSAHMHGELCLQFTEPFRGREQGDILPQLKMNKWRCWAGRDGGYYEILKKSYKLHAKFLQRMEY